MSDDEVWGETPQEKVMDMMYESIVNVAPDDWKPEIFGHINGTREEAIMYIEDPDGNCWEVTARAHGRHRDD
jgi:hypothetical protein